MQFRQNMVVLRRTSGIDNILYTSACIVLSAKTNVVCTGTYELYSTILSIGL